MTGHDSRRSCRVWGALTRSGVWSRVSSVESGARLADLEELLLFWSLCYLALRRVLQLVLLRSRLQGFKELEIVLLRHELSVLRRQVRRSRCGRVTGSFLLRPAAGSEIAGACAAFPLRDAGRPSASASERERPTRGPSRLVDTRNAAGARSRAAAPPTASVRRNTRYPSDTIRSDLRPSPERPRDRRRAQRRPEAAAQRSR